MNQIPDNNIIPPEFIGSPFIQKDTISVYKQTIPVNLYHFYLVEEIEGAAKYLELINTLKTAEEHDKVYLHINNGGGQIDTTIQIVSAMKESKATVITSLEGRACSAATIIFLNGHQFMVNDNCSFMIHNYSQWVGGKGNELDAIINFNKTYFEQLFYDTYLGFLTEDEIGSVLSGSDIWLHSDEVFDRLKLFDAYRTEIAKMKEKEHAIQTLEDLNMIKKDLMSSHNIKEEKPEKKAKKTTKKKVTKKKTTKKKSSKEEK